MQTFLQTQDFHASTAKFLRFADFAIAVPGRTRLTDSIAAAGTPRPGETL